MAKYKISSTLDKLMEEVLVQARSETDKELKLAMVDRVLKYEAMKIKNQQGGMGDAFDDDEPDQT